MHEAGNPVKIENDAKEASPQAVAMGSGWRDRIVQATPAPIINASSNVIGVMHVAAETLMLKASGLKFMKNNRGGDKANILIDPANNLWRGLTGADKEKAMQNHWSTRSTMSGFSAWVLGTVLPDKGENKEAIKQVNEESGHKIAPGYNHWTMKAKAADAKMEGDVSTASHTSKREMETKPEPNQSALGYAGSKLYESIQIGNPETKREQIGLGLTAAGVFSAISGFNNVNLKTGARFTNWSHAAGGLITALSGANLLFAKTDREGWQGFGSTIWLRLPLAGMSTYKKFQKHDRWEYYLGGQALFQSAAVYSYLYGGLEKLPDGTVIERETKGHHHKLEEDKPQVPLYVSLPHPNIAENVVPQNLVGDITSTSRVHENESRISA